MSIDLQEHTHRRMNPLTGEWILVSPHRAKRPWQGRQEQTPGNRPSFDPSCYLCPGNTRASGEANPAYESTYVFTNDFAALLPDGPTEERTEGREDGSAGKDLFRAEAERGTCRVICFSPRHDLTLARMSNEQIGSVVSAWKAEYASLGSLPAINYVQIFENKGAIMGCSNPHPHGQIWANETIPMIPALEGERQGSYLRTHHRCLLCDYLTEERRRKERIIFENDSFVALVPFWAVWPFEAMILPKQHISSLTELNERSARGLSDAIRRLCTRYDNLFDTDFPYSMGIHQIPTTGIREEGWHLHLHYYPPLLRSATVKKFMVGYEMLAMPQRDITPEASAARLRSLPDS